MISRAFENYGPIGSDIVVDDYGGILVTGSPFFYAPKQMAFAARFDGNGNNLWYKEYAGDMGMSGMYCLDNGNGTYQYVQNWWSVSNGGNNFLYVGQMDTMGTILSQKQFGRVNRAQFTDDLIRTHDGNFYVAGDTYYGNFHGFGMKFSPNGDSLWYRKYYYGDTLDLVRPEVFFQDADSNLVHAGWYADSFNPSDSNGVFSWFMRTDRYGCNIADCQLSLRDFEALKVLTLYPNPTKGSFRIKGLETGSYRLEIYSLEGSLKKELSFEQSESSGNWIETNLSSGAYLTIVKDKTHQIIGVSKLVVE